jgi:hypothetical protein
MNGASKKGKGAKIATRCKSHQDTRAGEKARMNKSTFEMANVEEKRTYNKRTKDVCTHRCRRKSLVVMMMENNFTLGERKNSESSENPSSHSKNYNDIVHSGCVEG